MCQGRWYQTPVICHLTITTLVSSCLALYREVNSFTVELVEIPLKREKKCEPWGFGFFFCSLMLSVISVFHPVTAMLWLHLNAELLASLCTGSRVPNYQRQGWKHSKHRCLNREKWVASAEYTSVSKEELWSGLLSLPQLQIWGGGELTFPAPACKSRAIHHSPSGTQKCVCTFRSWYAFADVLWAPWLMLLMMPKGGQRSVFRVGKWTMCRPFEQDFS